jgi:circadian clock protein KaiC
MGALDKGDIQIIEFTELMEKLGLAGVEITNDNMGVFIKGFIDLVIKNKVSRLVLDSLTGVCFQIKNRDNIRDFVFTLSKQLGEKKVTSLLVSEISPDSNSYSTHGVEEAITDGIIVLGNIAQRGHLLRTLHVVKMRGTVHSRAKYVMDLSSYGIIIVPLLKSQS